MQQRRFSSSSLLALALLATSGAAQAHTLGLPHLDFAAGLGHPVSGVDHILAMVAVGLWATQLGGRALWSVPLAFVLVLAFGAALGFLGVQLPLIEFGIAGSVLILGVLVALAPRWPLAASITLVGLFAVFHGYAHGAEMAVGASALWYSLGFLLATALLHGSGIGLGLLAQRASAAAWLRLGGVAIAASGFVLVMGPMI